MCYGAVERIVFKMNGNTKTPKPALPEQACVQVAAELERQLLPKTAPLIGGAEVAGWSIYSSKLGGDFFDYHVFEGVCCPSSRSMRIVVGDASDHGLCSALLMTTTRAYLRARAMQPGTLAQVIDDVNRLLCMDTASAGHFVTAFFTLIDGPERKIAWVRAGHDPALLYDPHKDMFELLNGSGIALGVDPQASYTMNIRTDLPRGAVVSIATDGLWETRFGNDGASGREVVRDLVRRHRHESAAEIAEAVKEAAHGLDGGSKAEDDMTFVAVRFV